MIHLNFPLDWYACTDGQHAGALAPCQLERVKQVWTSSMGVLITAGFEWERKNYYATPLSPSLLLSICFCCVQLLCCGACFCAGWGECVCVCVWEREREREMELNRERERDRVKQKQKKKQLFSCQTIKIWSIVYTLVWPIFLLQVHASN